MKNKNGAKDDNMANIVTAEFVRFTKKVGTDRTGRKVRRQCEYHYECNGKTYKYMLYSNDPPRTVTLLYFGNPKTSSAGFWDEPWRPDVVRRQRKHQINSTALQS